MRQVARLDEHPMTIVAVVRVIGDELQDTLARIDVHKHHVTLFNVSQVLHFLSEAVYVRECEP